MTTTQATPTNHLRLQVNDLARPVHHLLWTGGWDSTFRLLSLIHQGRPVQPYYLIDVRRRSLAREIDTMADLKRRIRQRFAFAPELLHPTQYHDLTDVPHLESCEVHLQCLKAIQPLGDQYAWIARFALSRSIDGLELSIHRDDKAHHFVAPSAVEVRQDNHQYFVLNDTLHHPAVELFRPFRFPLLQYTKLKMEEEARRNDFHEILEHTWFCHAPRRNGSPCGTCAPCCYTREEGLGRRIPWSSRLREKIGSISRALGRMGGV